MNSRQQQWGIRTALCCALLLICSMVHGQKQRSAAKTEPTITPVTISGKAEFAAGKEIRLIVFEDLLTYKTRVAATDDITADGSFHLTYTARHPELVQIAINTSKAEFYVEPGRSYDFSIEMDPQLFERLDPMAYGGFLQIKCNNQLPENDLNIRLNYFFNYVEGVLDYYSPNIIGDMDKSRFDSIDSVLHQKFPIEYAPNSYYKSNIYYTVASLERIIKQKQSDSLYHKYLDNEYVLYENPAYMNFFHEFYKNYLLTSPRIKRAELNRCINEDGTFLQLFNEVGKDEYLVNERIRELVIIDNLIELYNEDFSKKNIISILQEIAHTSHFDEHRLMAANAIETIKKFTDGSEITFPRMKEANGTDFDATVWKGKWVYIQFFSSDCDDCIREMMIISQLKKKYGEQIEFVSVSLDFNFGHFIQFLERFPQFDWHFVHFNNQFAWIDEMKITTLPDNILLNPDGTLSQRYAPDITRKLSVFLARLLKTEENESTPLDKHRPK